MGWVYGIVGGLLSLAYEMGERRRWPEQGPYSLYKSILLKDLFKKRNGIIHFTGSCVFILVPPASPIASHTCPCPSGSTAYHIGVGHQS